VIALIEKVIQYKSITPHSRIKFNRITALKGNSTLYIRGKKGLFLLGSLAKHATLNQKSEIPKPSPQ
jgi:hypothetical protein